MITRPSPLGRVPRGVPQRQLARSITVPAPVGGINAVDAATAMPATDAFDLVNMVGGRAGLTSRLGFAEWCIGMGSNPVRSVVPFSGSVASKDRLFACTSAEIFDCSSSTQTPTSKYTFGTTDATSGFGVSTVYVTSAGHFLFYADETNGLLRYDEAGTAADTWTAVTQTSGAGHQITGVNPALFRFVTSWKNRLLFVEGANLWYLPVGQIAGAASVIRLGNRFPHGGHLVGVWSWTIDGGAGVDDFLVAVSSAGDVLVYQGDDPATAGAFNLIGTWFVGAVPAGRRICTDIGGDLLILSMLGVVPMSRLRSGTVGPDVYTTRKIQSLFNAYATSSRRDLYGWALTLSPEENVLLVNLPLLGNSYEQLAMSLATSGWSLFQEVPALSMAVWGGKLYFGTYDGRLCKTMGDLDDVKLSGAATYDEIDWSGLTSFSDMGRASRKQIQEIEPLMWTQGMPPGYGVEARYDFDNSSISAVPPDPTAVTAVATWDDATWNTSVWPGDDTLCGTVRGATGMGTHAAIAWRGRSNARVTLMGFRVRWTDGGIR